MHVSDSEKDASQFTSGLLALLNGDCRALTFWTAVNDVNMTDRLGCTLLMHACRLADIEIATLLIEAGARTDISDVKGRSALHFANECDDSARAALVSALSHARD